MHRGFSPRELDIMAVLWQHGPSTAAEVRERLATEEGVELAYNTVFTVLRILEDKGHIAHEEEGRAFRYYPLVRREQAGARVVGRVVDKLFGGSAGLMLMQLVRERDISDDELRRLRALLDEQLGDGREEVR
jgi:BlaI family penicillinase repressor